MISELLAEVERRRRIMERLYDEFEEYRRRGEYGKAGESLWGIVNNMLYLLGLTQGVKLSRHGEFRDFVRDLATASNDADMIDEFRAAETLHANFYHEFMDEDLFTANSEKTWRLVRKLEKLLAGELAKLRLKAS